jgi:DNA-binding protein HU-beta
MTKADLVDTVASGTGLTKLETEAVLDGIISTIAHALINGEHVELRGFGVFRSVRRAPKIARNPKTNEEVPIPERMVPVFKPAVELRDQVKKNLKRMLTESK